jgi:hypothetical protein
MYDVIRNRIKIHRIIVYLSVSQNVVRLEKLFDIFNVNFPRLRF